MDKVGRRVQNKKKTEQQWRINKQPKLPTIWTTDMYEGVVDVT